MVHEDDFGDRWHRRCWIDHIVLAVPDLALAVADISESWGVVPTPGGVHDGRGTRNALVRLGEQTYLEVIGPDPDQPDPDRPRSFRVDERTGSGALAGFAVGTSDIDGLVHDLAKTSLDPGPVFAMSRTRPDGVRLDWRLTNHGNPAIPFFIDWGETESPALTSVDGVDLVSMKLTSPDESSMSVLGETLGLPLEAGGGPNPSLEVSLMTPGGTITLQS